MSEQVNWQKRCLIYEEFMANEYGITSDIFYEWLKIHRPEDINDFSCL